MAREIHSSDFSDAELLQFFGSVDHLIWSGDGGVPPAIETMAEEFAASPPTPTPDEMRAHIDQAVALARGWDHPDNRTIMLHSAIKAFYLMRWFEYVFEHAEAAYRTAAFRLRFSPNFRSPK